MTWTRTGTPVPAEISAAGWAQASPPTPVSSAKPRLSTRSREETGTPSCSSRACGTRAPGRVAGWLVVQLGVARRGGVRAAVVDDGVAPIAVPEFDAMGVELVVAQLDRLVQRVPALVPGGPGFVQGAECFPACLGGLSRLVPEGSL